MRKQLYYFLFTVASAALLASCAGNGDQAPGHKQDSAAVAKPVVMSMKAGVTGIFDVQEMTVLSRMDSASAKDMAFVLGRDYSVLEAEAAEIGAEIDGAPGVINYNNDPKNFKFECLLPIKTVPSKEPKQCQIVVLEATKMLVYNHYGPYEKLLDAYTTIRKYMAEHNIRQSGPMREFYLTDPVKETDPAKWLTRVMVPVEGN